jgi:hypothetical protein
MDPSEVQNKELDFKPSLELQISLSPDSACNSPTSASLSPASTSVASTIIENLFIGGSRPSSTGGRMSGIGSDGLPWWETSGVRTPDVEISLRDMELSPIHDRIIDGPKPLLICVDDHPIQEKFHKGCRNPGHEKSVFTRAQEGVDHLQEKIAEGQRFIIVIMDLEMPATIEGKDNEQGILAIDSMLEICSDFNEANPDDQVRMYHVFHTDCSDQVRMDRCTASNPLRILPKATTPGAFMRVSNTCIQLENDRRVNSFAGVALGVGGFVNERGPYPPQSWESLV